MLLVFTSERICLTIFPELVLTGVRICLTNSLLTVASNDEWIANRERSHSVEAHGTVAIPQGSPIEEDHSSAVLGQIRGDGDSAVPYQSRGNYNGVDISPLARSCSTTGSQSTHVIAITAINV